MLSRGEHSGSPYSWAQLMLRIRSITRRWAGCRRAPRRHSGARRTRHPRRRRPPNADISRTRLAFRTPRTSTDARRMPTKAMHRTRRRRTLQRMCSRSRGIASSGSVRRRRRAIGRLRSRTRRRLLLSTSKRRRCMCRSRRELRRKRSAYGLLYETGTWLINSDSRGGRYKKRKG